MAQTPDEVSSFFEFSDAAIAPQLKTKQGYGDFTFFCSTVVVGMEFAVLDCLFLSEGDFSKDDLSVREQFSLYFPQFTEEMKLFLRRAEGTETWEAMVMENVSKDGYSDPYIAFNSKKDGMIVFGAEYACFCVTEDGGETWVVAGSIPSPAESVVGSVRCMIGCGEGRFLVGHRYKGTSEEGQLSLTEDHGQTWTSVVLPAPQTGELKYCYSEPVEFWEQDGKLFVRMHAYAEEEAVKTEDGQDLRKEAFYELFSMDDGLTWEFVQEGILDFQTVD